MVMMDHRRHHVSTSTTTYHIHQDTVGFNKAAWTNQPTPGHGLGEIEAKAASEVSVSSEHREDNSSRGGPKGCCTALHTHTNTFDATTGSKLCYHLVQPKRPDQSTHVCNRGGTITTRRVEPPPPERTLRPPVNARVYDVYFYFLEFTLVTRAAEVIPLDSRASFVKPVQGSTIGTDMLTRLGGRWVGSASKAVSISLKV